MTKEMKMDTELITALLFILSRGVVVRPRIQGRPDAGWHISLAEEERMATTDETPTGTIGGLGGS